MELHIISNNQTFIHKKHLNSIGYGCVGSKTSAKRSGEYMQWI